MSLAHQQQGISPFLMLLPIISMYSLMSWACAGDVSNNLQHIDLETFFATGFSKHSCTSERIDF